MIYRFAAVVAVAGTAALSFSLPAQALTSKECSAKFKAAEAANLSGGLKYADYRKAECGTGASATPTAAPATTPAATPAAAPTAAPTTTPAAAPPAARTAAPTKPAPAPTAAPATAGAAVFPTAVSPKYAKETAGKQRMHTCLDQYNANKAANSNGGLKWIQKGGGYYSQCNARLKTT